jgi:hypothetical protein
MLMDEDLADAALVVVRVHQPPPPLTPRSAFLSDVLVREG